jgi:hypothetical protein
VQHGIQFNNAPVSHGEGPSCGKGVDPCTWGAAGIPNKELDLDAQQNMLQDWEVQCWIKEDCVACRECKFLNRDAERDVEAMNNEASEPNAESTDKSNPESETDIEVCALLKEHIRLKRLLRHEVNKMKAELAKISKKPWKGKLHGTSVPMSQEVENLIKKVATNQKETAQKAKKSCELKADMQPITQVNPGSSLEKLKKHDEPSDNSSSSDSDSESSTLDSSSALSDSSKSSSSSSLSLSSGCGQCNKCGKGSKKS